MSGPDDLSRLEALVEDGLLSREEFESAKRRLLAGSDSPEPQQEPSPSPEEPSGDGSSLPGAEVPVVARRVPKWAAIVAGVALVGLVFFVTRESADEQAQREALEIIAEFEAEMETCVRSVFAWIDTFTRDGTFVGTALGFQTDEYWYIYETAVEARRIQFSGGTEAAVAEIQPKVINFCANNPESRARFIRVHAPGFSG